MKYPIKLIANIARAISELTALLKVTQNIHAEMLCSSETVSLFWTSVDPCGLVVSQSCLEPWLLAPFFP